MTIAIEMELNLDEVRMLRNCLSDLGTDNPIALHLQLVVNTAIRDAFVKELALNDTIKQEDRETDPAICDRFSHYSEDTRNEQYFVPKNKKMIFDNGLPEYETDRAICDRGDCNCPSH